VEKGDATIIYSGGVGKQLRTGRTSGCGRKGGLLLSQQNKEGGEGERNLSQKSKGRNPPSEKGGRAYTPWAGGKGVHATSGKKMTSTVPIESLGMPTSKGKNVSLIKKPPTLNAVLQTQKKKGVFVH